MKPQVCAAAAADPSSLGLALRLSLSQVIRGRVSVCGRENLQLPLLSQMLLSPGCVFCVFSCVRVCVRALVSWMCCFAPVLLVVLCGDNDDTKTFIVIMDSILLLFLLGE